MFGKGHDGDSGAGGAITIADAAVVDKAALAAEELGCQHSLQSTGRRGMPVSEFSFTAGDTDAAPDALLISCTGDRQPFGCMPPMQMACTHLHAI
jgi:hypothetical protein